MRVSISFLTLCSFASFCFLFYFIISPMVPCSPFPTRYAITEESKCLRSNKNSMFLQQIKMFWFFWAEIEKKSIFCGKIEKKNRFIGPNRSKKSNWKISKKKNRKKNPATNPREKAKWHYKINPLYSNIKSRTKTPKKTVFWCHIDISKSQLLGWGTPNIYCTITTQRPVPTQPRSLLSIPYQDYVFLK